MKSLLTVVLSLFTVIFLIFGYSYWKSTTKVKPIDNPVKTENLEKNQKKEIDDPEEENQVSLLDFVGTWPQDAVDEYKVALEANTPFKFAIIGSQSVGADHSWAKQLQQEFQSVFGKTIEIELFEFAHMNTNELIEDGYEEVITFNPNMILFESLSLNDNTDGIADSSNDNISEFVESFADATFIIQPSQPIYNAQAYPIQIDNQETFVSELGITYLNHWDSWPDFLSEEIREYLPAENQGIPNEKGQDLWFTYLKDYFFK